MTKEEASFILANIDRRVCDDELNEALDMAIKALEQEPCEDAISREAVQDLIATWLSDYLTDETREVLETIDYKIGDMPSVYPNIGRWIPVSERMPKKNGNYLITYCYRNEYCHRDEIETEEAAYVYDEDEEEDKWFDITDIEITLAVKAWMPLPDPYKEESEG